MNFNKFLKEITTKLVDLTWNDMHQSVRKVAAQTLGRTGKGKYVHDEILRRLKSQKVFDKCEALNKLSYLGIMTPCLLDIYLKCFRDDCISVKELTIKCSQNLMNINERVLDALVYVVRFEKVTKLKSLALRSKTFFWFI
jgi:hypothetical protein